MINQFICVHTYYKYRFVYTVPIQHKNTTLLLFIAHSFVKGSHLFFYIFAHRYDEKPMASATMNCVMDQQTGTGAPFVDTVSWMRNAQVA